MSKRILFLDFDGVLHDANAAKIEYEGSQINVAGDGLFKHASTLAAALCGYPDVDVVISSSWRNHFPLSELVERLGALGERVTDTTKQMQRKSRDRYSECAAYAEERQVADWLMIDDQPEIVFGSSNPPPAQQVRLLVCDSNLALDTPEVLPSLRKWLAQKTPSSFTHGSFALKHMMSCARDTCIDYTINWQEKTITVAFSPARTDKPFFSAAALESLALRLLNTVGIDLLTRDNEEWGPPHQSDWTTIVDMGGVRLRATLIKPLVGAIVIEMECLL